MFSDEQINRYVDAIIRMISNAENISISFMTANAELILSHIKEQLWNGEDAFGNNISPSYLQDPYFNSAREARNYAVWKDNITPNPQRDFSSPNLFINGYFWNSLYIDETGEVNSHYLPEIITKYGGERTFSLQDKNYPDIEEAWETYFTNYLQENIISILS